MRRGGGCLQGSEHGCVPRVPLGSRLDVCYPRTAGFWSGDTGAGSLEFNGG